jgi:uncharacterized protein
MSRRFKIILLLALSALVAFRFRWRIMGRLLGLPAQYDVDVQVKIPVTMPDGVRLMTDHYFPRASGRFPTILIRSTYGRGSDAPFPINLLTVLPGNLIATCGYHVVVQTTRGRFDSEGTDDAVFADDEPDGRATLDWIAQQPWFDGNLSMFGSSYLGYTQWAVAENAPSYLKAIAPSIIMTAIYDLVFPDGAFALDLIEHWMLIVEVIDSGAKGRELGKYFAPDYPPLLEGLNHLPMSDSDRVVVGKPVAFFQRSLEDLYLKSDYWRHSDKRDVPANVSIPVHLMGGWYDFCLRGLLNDYTALKHNGNIPYLTIGPWAHTDLIAQPTFLRESIMWYEAHLKGKREKLRKQPVRIYVMGADEWREMQSWPPPAQSTRYHLHGQKRLSTEQPETTASPDTYRYDPTDPTPSVGGAVFMPPGAGGAKDNTLLEARQDVLTYTTLPLSRDLEVIGGVRLELYVCSSLEYTDFFGRLCDVHPDGHSFNVCDGLLRVEPGKGERQVDGTLKIEVDMTSTAHCFKIGHAIRLQVSSGAHPRWSRNPGSGEPLLEATHLCIADQQIYHDAAHPSGLVLPVC